MLISPDVTAGVGSSLKPWIVKGKEVETMLDFLRELRLTLTEFRKVLAEMRKLRKNT